jgi:ribonuclease HII
MKKVLIGVDEVGRGPVAGPVHVCAFKLFDNDLNEIIENAPHPLKDSKKLTEKRRKEWFIYLQDLKKKEKLSYSIVSMKASDVDKYGIAVCIKKLVDRSVSEMYWGNEGIGHVYLDGGLFLTDTKIPSTTIIKGDESIQVIALASIVAKVIRDIEMVNYAKDYPNYRLESNKGYGTKEHMEAIKRCGLTDLHRKSFLKKFL